MYWAYANDEGINGPSSTGYDRLPDGPARRPHRVGPSQLGARELSRRVELCHRTTTAKSVSYFSGGPRYLVGSRLLPKPQMATRPRNGRCGLKRSGLLFTIWLRMGKPPMVCRDRVGHHYRSPVRGPFLLYRGVQRDHFVQFFVDGQRTLHVAIFEGWNWLGSKQILLDRFHLQDKCEKKPGSALRGGRCVAAHIFPVTLSASNGVRNRGEEAHDLCVARRQKHHGMSWSPKGSVAITRDVTLQHNRETAHGCADHHLDFQWIA